MPRIFLIAGEASGDSHGAALIKALRDQAPDLECEGLGGPKMAEAGMQLHEDLASNAIMGFVEVVRHFKAIRRTFLDTLARIEAARPDVLVLIDYPGFNLRMAKAVHHLKIPVVYYISPQIWAWKKGRIHTIAAHVRKMLVIFPFEEDLYKNAGIDCAYVGHPLLDTIPAPSDSAQPPSPHTIGLLPGSRKQEIERLLVPMLEVARGLRAHYPEARFVTPCINEDRAQLIRRIAADFPLEIQVGTMHDLLKSARFCLVASGTATLETALFGVPFLILYRTNPATYWMARAVVNIKNIGIVNILAGRTIVPEFIQHAIRPERIVPLACRLIEDSPERNDMRDAFQEVRALLGGGGAAQRAAREILTLIPAKNTPGAPA